jgi:L,D-transpeptidase catalytic domain
MKTRSLWAALLCATAATNAFAQDAALLAALSSNAPTANAKVLELALLASHCAQRGKLASAPLRLIVIDYSRPSLEPRLWLFDLDAATLLLTDYVAHGRNSGDNLAVRFSNTEGSLQSSLGLFVGRNSYFGKNGRSLRLQGLEPGFNDRAMQRAIVLHSADYVNPSLGANLGRLGRSHGCPVVRPALNDQVIDALRNGQHLYVYYPDPDWLRRSKLLQCEPERTAFATAPKTPSATITLR